MIGGKIRVTGIISLSLSIHLLCHGCSSVETPVQRRELGKTGIMSIYSPALSHYDGHAKRLARLLVKTQPDEDIRGEFTQRIEPLLRKRLVRVNPPCLRNASIVSNSECSTLSREYFIDSLIILHIYPGEVRRRWSMKSFDWNWAFSFHTTARIVDLAKGEVLWETVAGAPFDVIDPSPPARIIDEACRSQVTYLADRLVDELSKGLLQDNLPQG
ncbi:hypothetical protein ACFL4G_08495 [Thermodesulfobacteriota bacterium]